MECFRLLFNQIAWIEHLFLSGIRDSRKAGSLWGMIRGVGGVTKSAHQSWLVKRLGLGYYAEVLREFRKRFSQKRPELFKTGQWHFHQDNAPVHNSILVTDYLTKMDIKTVPYSPYSPDLAPCDFWREISNLFVSQNLGSVWSCVIGAVTTAFNKSFFSF